MITGKSAISAADHIFTMSDKKAAKVLDEERTLVFQHTVAQLLFMLMRARSEIHMAVVFLTTRVKRPDEDEWGKLKPVLKFLTWAKYLKLKLSADDLGILKWYVDGLHNAHWDCWGHGEAMFTLGKGSLNSYLRKVKLNTRSLTETELVTANMYMSEMLWSLYFIQSQGYKPEWVGLYQGNISTQLLIKKGTFFSGEEITRRQSSSLSRIG